MTSLVGKIRTRSRNTLTCPQRHGKPLNVSRPTASRFPPLLSRTSISHSYWKLMPLDEAFGAVLSQKQADGRYHPIAYASCVMNETEQRYHSNKQEFLALKWAITRQFHEYLSPTGRTGTSLWFAPTTTRSLTVLPLPI